MLIVIKIKSSVHYNVIKAIELMLNSLFYPPPVQAPRPPFTRKRDSLPLLIPLPGIASSSQYPAMQKALPSAMPHVAIKDFKDSKDLKGNAIFHCVSLYVSFCRSVKNQEH